MITTPAKPLMIPTTRPRVSLSSAVARCATMTVNSGVVALRIEASPLAMCVWLHTIRLNGTTLLRKPMPASAAQAEAPRGSRRPIALATRMSTSAPSPTRAHTMVSGGSSNSATLLKKNEPPHNTDSSTSSSHSAADMVEILATRGFITNDTLPASERYATRNPASVTRAYPVIASRRRSNPEQRVRQRDCFLGHAPRNVGGRPPAHDRSDSA